MPFDGNPEQFEALEKIDSVIRLLSCHKNWSKGGIVSGHKGQRHCLLGAIGKAYKIPVAKEMINGYPLQECDARIQGAVRPIRQAIREEVSPHLNIALFNDGCSLYTMRRVLQRAREIIATPVAT